MSPEKERKKKNIMKQTRTQRTKEKTRNLPCARCVGASRGLKGFLWSRVIPYSPGSSSAPPIVAAVRVPATLRAPLQPFRCRSCRAEVVCRSASMRCVRAPHRTRTARSNDHRPFLQTAIPTEPQKRPHTRAGVSSPWEARKRLERLAVFNAELDCHTFAQLDTCPSSIESCNGECGQKATKQMPCVANAC